MPSKSTLTSSAGVDPTLAALFASSAGPVRPSKKPRYSDVAPQDDDGGDSSDASGSTDDDEVPDSDGSAVEDESDDPELEESSDSPTEAAAVATLLDAADNNRKRKRKPADEHDDLESKYFEKVAADDDEEDEARAKRPKKQVRDGGDADASMGLVHESLLQDSGKGELDKAGRTVFLSNVSTEAITSKLAKKQLLAHLSSVLEKDASPAQTIESLRFRSVPVATAAMPKRAAVITEAVMDATTKSANAYVVYSDAAGARAAVSKLNGTIVLGRHLRTDSVAHPAPVDHRRCVFVGNLGFVDDETVLNLTVDEDGKEKTERRKRTKVPMDVEEGLWQTFGKHAGKVENVRVVRDEVTRVGKGFAYVQFYDANSVEEALLLDGKKFPPLLPRALRVTRCKAPHKTARAMERANKSRAAVLAGTRKPKATKYVRKVTDEERTGAGRASKLLGRSAAARFDGSGKPRGGRGKPSDGARTSDEPAFKSPEEIVFEGYRASSKDKPNLKFKGSKSKKPKSGPSGNQKRRAARAANWKGKGPK